MEKPWYQELEEQYIHLFETDEFGIPVRGIECGVGWKRHVESFLKRCDWILNHNNYIPNPDFDDTKPSCIENPRAIPNPLPQKIKIFQIKEKFAECRCYVNYENCSEIQMRQTEIAIAALVAKCSLTCESCGKLGYDMVKGNYWVYAACDECFTKITNKVN